MHEGGSRRQTKPSALDQPSTVPTLQEVGGGRSHNANIDYACKVLATMEPKLECYTVETFCEIGRNYCYADAVYIDYVDSDFLPYTAHQIVCEL